MFGAGPNREPAYSQGRDDAERKPHSVVEVDAALEAAFSPSVPDRITNQHMHQFQECAECASKAGSPILCASCNNNRSAINQLSEDAAHLRRLLAIVRQVLDI